MQRLDQTIENIESLQRSNYEPVNDRLGDTKDAQMTCDGEGEEEQSGGWTRGKENDGKAIINAKTDPGRSGCL